MVVTFSLTSAVICIGNKVTISYCNIVSLFNSNFKINTNLKRKTPCNLTSSVLPEKQSAIE